MKTPRMRPGRLKLNLKFSLIILCAMLVPVLLLAAVLFDNMSAVLIEERVKEVETGLLQTRADVVKVAEMCSLTAQSFLNNTSLIAFLAECKTGAGPGAERILSFYRADIASLEKLVNANPYLYQARVYQPNENVPEIMPVLYHQSRMNRLAWAGEDLPDGGWYFDYSDTLFDESVMRATPHIMARVMPVEDYSLGRLGVLEVAVRMDEALPGLFAAGGRHSALVVGGHWYTGEGSDAFIAENRDALQGLAGGAGNGATTVEGALGREAVLVSSIPLEPLGGYYLTVTYRSDLTASFAARQNLFLLVTAVIVLLLVLVVNRLVKALLRRFYRVVDTVAQVGEGNLEVQVPKLGHDEVGLLAEQIGQMLQRIQSLMQENIDRQLAAKNSEIRALQSQINAHFIYNVLESIKMTAEVDGYLKVSDAITRLGRMLRYSMHWDTPSSTVAEEVASVENYLALINLRFDYAVSLETRLPPALMGQRIPKMTLQPLVENAVVHGIEELAQDTAILIEAVREGADFCLEVTDYGKGIEPARLAALREELGGAGAKEGLGLKNVQDRLAMTFGPAYGIEIESHPGAYTRIRFRIPFHGEGEG